MISLLNILPECEADTRVVNIIMEIKQSVRHRGGINEVVEPLKNQKSFLFNDSALAIVDEDKLPNNKRKSNYPNYFLEFVDIKSTERLSLKKHKIKAHYLIEIKPAIEVWLLNEAIAVNVNPTEYNLSANLKELIIETKKKEIERNEDFTRFIKALKRNNAPSITLLKEWIDAFRNNQINNIN